MKCEDCERVVEPDWVPSWREFRLFGQTWIFGRWKDKIVRDRCLSCEHEKQQSDECKIMDEVASYAAEKAYEQGFAEGRGGY